MKRIFGIFAGLILCSMFWTVQATADASAAPVTSYASVIEVHTVYDQYGVAIGSDSTTTTTTTTTAEDGTTSTTVQVNVAHSEWIGGSLKTKSIDSTSNTTSSDGSTSHREYTDVYEYDSSGGLLSVSGSGTSTSYDAESGQTSSGTSTRNFEVRDGQALLMSQTDSGSTTDKDGREMSTYTSTTTNSDWVYAGGQWVSDVSTTHSRTDVLDGPDSGNGSWTDTTRTTTYTRNEAGTVTGVHGSISGERFQVTGINNGEVSGIHYTMQAIGGQPTLDFQFDSQMGWYLAGENYQWISDEEPDMDGYDPWTQGTLAIVDGHLALIVDSDDLKGGFYSTDPTKVTGETKKDKDGNYIFMVRIDDEDLQRELEGLVGHRINLGWQNYATAETENSRGYAWIGSLSDGRQGYHMQHDNQSLVEQFGGTWDRSKPYVLID